MCPRDAPCPAMIRNECVSLPVTMPPRHPARWTNSSISDLLVEIAIPLAVLLQQPNQHLRLRVKLHPITYILLLPITVSNHGVSVSPRARLTKPFANSLKAASSCSSSVATVLLHRRVRLDPCSEFAAYGGDFFTPVLVGGWRGEKTHAGCVAVRIMSSAGPRGTRWMGPLSHSHSQQHVPHFPQSINKSVGGVSIGLTSSWRRSYRGRSRRRNPGSRSRPRSEGNGSSRCGPSRSPYDNVGICTVPCPWSYTSWAGPVKLVSIFHTLALAFLRLCTRAAAGCANGAVSGSTAAVGDARVRGLMAALVCAGMRTLFHVGRFEEMRNPELVAFEAVYLYRWRW